jgi:hypothetical protein
LRIDGKSAELFGCSTSLLELHYVQKLHGRREILEGGEDDDDDDDGKEEEEEGGGEATSLLPARIIIKIPILNDTDKLGCRRCAHNSLDNYIHARPNLRVKRRRRIERIERSITIVKNNIGNPCPEAI